jgi:hypothetical protein
MPNRILKESICSSDNIDQLSAFQETMFYRLIVNCDDFGRYDARPKVLASRLFPLRDIRAQQIQEALRALSSAELVILYEVDGKPFLQMKTWDRHQQVRAKKSKYPAPESGVTASDIICNQMQADETKCPRNPIQSESNPNPIRERETPAPVREAHPTAEDVRAYAQQKGLTLDADRFVDFYASKGWKVGNAPMKDWRAAVRNWCARDKQPAANTQTTAPRGPKVVREQQYTQREYEDKDELPDWMLEKLKEGQYGV